MTKTPKRRIARRSPAAPKAKRATPFLEGRTKTLLVVGLVLVLAGVPFILGKYFEFKSPGAFDSGSYVYSAKHILSGARIGYDEKPSAQAGTLLFNMLGVWLFGYNEVGAELLQTLVQAAALVLMFLTVRRLYGTLAGIISVTVASVYLSAPLCAKFGNVKEQFMIAFMVMGICCFVFYRLKGRWWWAVLCGAALVWGPMFKQTGLSAIAATGLFVLAEPILRRSGWKAAGKDLLLLTAGGLAVLVPICIWYASTRTPLHYWPYSFVLEPALSVFSSGESAEGDSEAAAATEPASASAEPKAERGLILRLLPGYVSDSWEALKPEARKEAYRRVLRYYRLLILPIVLALGAIVARFVTLWRGRGAEKGKKSDADAGPMVLLFAVWWFFDMAFVWISPRSYEQYYLPLNASAAMLGGYLVHLYDSRLQGDRDKSRWLVVGLVGLVVMLGLSWHMFFGIRTSPHSGSRYTNERTGKPEHRRGYLQKWQEVRRVQAYSWQNAGDYIREHSEPTDRIYVWGWVPGIYVQAQRLSATPKPFEGTMHTLPPATLAERVREILGGFEKYPPKFIVDTRKEHFPWDRPCLELWPITTFRGPNPVAFLPPNTEVIGAYDKSWTAALRQNWGDDEAARYEAMAPLRKYVMENYRVVELEYYGAVRTRFGIPTLCHKLGLKGTFGEQIVFVRK